jgi:hypothetical protein
VALAMSSSGFDPDVWIQLGPLRGVREDSFSIEACAIRTYQPSNLVDHFDGSEGHVRVTELCGSVLNVLDPLFDLELRKS